MYKFDAKAAGLISDLRQESYEYGILRINSVMILRGLLEMDESPLYQAIFDEQIDPTVYPTLIDQCYLNYDEKKPFHLIKGKQGLKGANGKKRRQEQSQEKISYPKLQIEDKDIEFDLDVIEIFTYLVEHSVEIFGILDITKALIYAMPKGVLKVFKTFGISEKELREYFNVDGEKEEITEKSKFTIPKELKSFIRDLNVELKGRVCDIAGRDRECELLWETLQKQTKRNAVLVGEPGVGKTSVVKKIVFDILEGNCPEEFKNTRVLSMDVNSSVAGTVYRGQAEKRYAELAEFLENSPNVILFIDEIHLIRGAGATEKGGIDLANAIKPILSGDKVRVIGATTSEEYEMYFSQDGAIKRRFRPIEIREPKSREVYEMLEKSITTLSNFHSVSISREMVDFIILNSACFNYETKNPDRTKDLIDLSMVVAKKQGKKEVDKDCVLANFKYNIEQFENMQLSTKKGIAFHEAGHCLVAMCSPYFKNLKVIAVSIMPTDSYLGVTVYEEVDGFIPDGSMECHIDHIAMSLAGRVAEALYTSKLSSGAASDLRIATSEAHNLVSMYGMGTFSKKAVFAEFNSQKVMNRVNREIDKIVKKATKRASQIINDNYLFLCMIVDELVKNDIVSRTKLEEIKESCKQQK